MFTREYFERKRRKESSILRKMVGLALVLPVLSLVTWYFRLDDGFAVYGPLVLFVVVMGPILFTVRGQRRMRRIEEEILQSQDEFVDTLRDEAARLRKEEAAEE